MRKCGWFSLKKLVDQTKLIYELFLETERALLLVLDACNWRILASLKPKWNVKVVRSRGSHTHEWLQRSFQRPLKEVLYISSNPHTYVLKDIRMKFKHIVDLYFLCWNDALQTVHPRAVNLFAKEKVIAGEKKLIAHYLQPHAPFIGDTWLNLHSHDFRGDMKELKIYDLARRSSEARKEFARAYINNLILVTNYVELLAESVRAIDSGFNIVVSADHSEVVRGVYCPTRGFRKRIWLWIPWALGIHRFVGHESRSSIEQLYEVPWVRL